MINRARNGMLGVYINSPKQYSFLSPPLSGVFVPLDSRKVALIFSSILLPARPPCVQIQTEFHLYHKGDGIHHKEHDVVKEYARVFQMYNELKKRYNKEVKTNQRQNETVAMLSVSFNHLITLT
uniref:Uncharacterized protein n=1 Tax=Micrurus surinamensis TaxID=129470 RepID=A0A2D4PN62_MICSU